MEPLYPKNISRLISRYLRGTITNDEQAVLDTWRTSKPERAQLFQQLVEGNFLVANLYLLNEIDSEVALASLKRRIGNAKPKVREIRRWLSYAAALLITCIVSILTWQQTNKTSITHISEIEVSPGSNRATLTLQDGRSITLDEARTGIVVGEEVRYSDGSELLSNVSGQLIMSTPKAGTYQLTLPDGSEVWLNAATTITYPSKFTGGERVVRLEGEAYFSVRRDDAKPFRVLSAGQKLEVLGTEFGLSAYPDENHIKTTLVTGKVKIAADNSRSSILKPGEQGIFSKGVFTIAQVDVGQQTSWKDGWISFDNKPFDEIMREVERWYDIDIQYEGPIPQEVGYGMAPRTENLSVVLNLLKAGNIHFRLEGRTLIIISE